MKNAIKLLRVVLAVTAGSSALANTAHAEDFAPPSLAARLFSATVLSASPPFTASGGYKLFTSPIGSNFVGSTL